MTKDTRSIEDKLSQYDARVAMIRKLIAHPMSADQRELLHEAVDGVVDLLGLDFAILPVSMILTCPACNVRHLDEGATKPHHTHACQGCGMVWRPAIVATTGVQFLPGCDACFAVRLA